MSLALVAFRAALGANERRLGRHLGLLTAIRVCLALTSLKGHQEETRLEKFTEQGFQRSRGKGANKGYLDLDIQNRIPTLPVKPWYPSVSLKGSTGLQPSIDTMKGTQYTPPSY